MSIHPAAMVDKTAEIDQSVEIGAYAIVEPDVRIGADTRIYPHAYTASGTTIGERCQIHPFAVVGHVPQDRSFKGEPSFTRIGDDTIVREQASIHRGAIPGSITVVGRHCFVMANAHVAHNCQLGDHVTMANGVLLAGHVHVGDRVFFGGGASVHQFVRVGEMAMLSGLARVPMDVPPFMIAGPRGVSGPNVVGLRRAGVSSEERRELREAYRLLYRSGLLFRAAVERLAEVVKTDPGRRLVAFLQADSRRGILGCQCRGEPTPDSDG